LLNKKTHGGDGDAILALKELILVMTIFSFQKRVFSVQRKDVPVQLILWLQKESRIGFNI